MPLAEPRLIYDLGCGPGNSTALLAKAYPGAEIIGVDSSPDMLAAARAALPDRQFIEGDLSIWRTDRRADLVFANAVFQWVPGHVGVLREFVEDLKKAACLRCRCLAISTSHRTSHARDGAPRAVEGASWLMQRRARDICRRPWPITKR